MKTNTLDFDAQALREKILDLAMRGKLVPQDPDDEPASVLLEKIKAEKEQLIKEKKIKKAKSLDPITDEEKPFEIPDSWEWVRLGDVAEITSGGTPKTSEKSYWENGNIPWITPAVMSETKTDIIFNNHKIKYINNLGLENSSAHLIPKNSLVMSSRAPIGYVNIVPFEYTTNQGCKSVTLYSETIKEFVYFALKFAIPDMNKRASGTTFKEISGTKFGQTLIPLPPLSEQSRIAAKIAQLFALLRKVESSTQQYTKLQTLLKSKVLDLAMRGKLIEQDPHDEPASVLLEKIKVEKEQLIKEKKIKKSKPLPPITDKEKPFDIPDSWEWVRLGDIGIWAAGATPSRRHSEYYGGDIPWLKTGDLNDDIIEDTSEKITELGVRNSFVKVNKPGNVLIAMYGATIGKLGIVGKRKLVTNQACCGCTPYNEIYNWYLFYYLFSSRKRLIDLGSGGAQPNISKQKIEKFSFPLPPLPEQKRIVERIKILSELISTKG